MAETLGVLNFFIMFFSPYIFRYTQLIIIKKNGYNDCFFIGWCMGDEKIIFHQKIISYRNKFIIIGGLYYILCFLNALTINLVNELFGVNLLLSFILVVTLSFTPIFINIRKIQKGVTFDD